MSKVKCYPYDGQKTVYAQGKRDGIYLRLINGKAYTSINTDITNQVKHYSWFKNIFDGGKLGIHTSNEFLGELYVPGEPASTVKTNLAVGGPLQFSCFAIPSFPSDMDLVNLEEYCKKNLIDFCPYLLNNYSSVLKTYAALLTVDPDLEGIVYKDSNMSRWYKWKPIKTIDGVITAIKPGKGKYKMMAGSIEIAVYRDKDLINIANVSGFDDIVRAEISQTDVGRVVEVKYQYVGAKGRLRHPRFSRYRDDKLPHECLIDQDYGLMRVWGK